MKTFRFLLIFFLVLSFSGAMESCKPQYGSKSLEKRKRRLKRKYKRNGINDCPVFDCRNMESRPNSLYSYAGISL